LFGTFTNIINALIIWKIDHFDICDNELYVSLKNKVFRFCFLDV
jgi:hypothetical protein